MASNMFHLVKAAIPAHADALLAEYGVKPAREGTKIGGDWTTGYICPFCDDKNGSCSFTPKLYLKCHQCSTKLDVFDWLSKHTGKKAWDVAKEMAERLNVSLPKAQTRSFKSMPTRMTEALLSKAIDDLWEHPDAELARKALAERRLDDQVLLTELEVGWIKGWIVFVTRDEKGILQDRYRGWQPWSRLKWMWYGQGSGGVGIWPSKPAEEGKKIWLAEGESDVMAAMVRLRMHELDWHVCTWTAGATSTPRISDIPRWMHGREVHIGYDNDVFQGPDYHNYYLEVAPGKKPDAARAALEQRLQNLLNKLAPTFIGLNCNVFIRQCPVLPKEKWGGDMRDWIAMGGRDLSEWKTYEYDKLPDYGKNVLEVDFERSFSNLHRRIKTRVQVEGIARDDVTLSKIFEMRCAMGTHPACANCPGMRLFPDGIIDMEPYQRELSVGLEQQDVVAKILKDVVQKPYSCPRCEIVPVDVTTGSEWTGMAPGRSETTTQRSLHVFSREAPSLSGEMELEGVAYPNAKGNGVVFLADSIKHLDRTEVDLLPYLNDFQQVCPHSTDDIEEIDRYLDQRARDLSFHVTKIHGRRDIHVAADLLAHSALRANLYGAQQRSWLDVAIYGDTRTGKSLTFRRLLAFHGLGQTYAAVSNMSRAGLLMGSSPTGMCLPGLIPKANGKMALIDEWHFFVAQAGHDHPMSWLQGVRDDGIASGIKIYGARDLPAAVRFGIISNWMRNKRKVYEFDCEHLGALYGAPETVARLDFGLAVSGDPTQAMLDEVHQIWTKDRTRALILRAWAMQPSQVVIDEKAQDQARAWCNEWRNQWESEILPLFTPEEKAYSLLRIAIAVANVTFSHPKHDIYSVHVRKVHVDWAAQWLLHTWHLSGYDKYSEKKRESHHIIKMFHAESGFVVDLEMQDPTIAMAKLRTFLTPFSASEVSSLTGLELSRANQWLARMTSYHVFERVRDRNGYSVQYHLTLGGQKLVHSLMRMSEEHETWFPRYAELHAWHSNFSPVKPDPNLPSIDTMSWRVEDDEALPF